MAQRKTARLKAQKVFSVLGIILLLSILLAACGDPQLRNNASTNKATLDKEILHAQSIGVPASLLNPIINQENKISGSSAPLFSTPAANQFYSNQSKSYQTLDTQLKGMEYQQTQQSGTQASTDLKTFSSILTQRQSQGFVEASTFQTKYKNVQKDMNQAKLLKDYLNVSQEASQDAEALELMGPANDDLTTLKSLINTLNGSKIDTTSLSQQSTNDVTMFRNAQTPDAFTNIINTINTQIASANTISTQAVPYVGESKLTQFQTSIDTFKSLGGDPSSYQTMHDNDKTLLNNGEYNKFSTQVDSDMTSLKLPLLKLQATSDLNTIMNSTKSWGASHEFHDDFNNQDYQQAYEYWNGTLYDDQTALGVAETADDYQAIINDVKQETTLFNAQKADYDDKTPLDQPHQSDLDLMKSLGVTSGKVIVTSLIQDQMRVYENGKLVHAAPVVSGDPDKPTPPGFTQIFNRQAPATFVAFDQNKDSPFYYPDTHINYAMEYHIGEYYYHDSWWRDPNDYGLGTKYPHYAPAASNMGTHGCINMSLDEAAWLWNFTSSVSATTPVYSIVY